MRRPGTFAAITLLVLSLARAEEPANPFEGWDAEQIEKHARGARAEITSRMNRWLKARKDLVAECSACRGKGVVKAGRGQEPCLACRQSGIKVDRDNFLKASWEYMTPRYREDAKRRLMVLRRTSAARDEPETAAESLQQISRGRVLSVEVYGNHAEAEFEEILGRDKFNRKMEWLEIDGEWWIADPAVDQAFARVPYAGPATSGTAPVGPASEPVEPAPPAGEKEPAKPIVPRAPPKDPDQFFSMGEVTVKHVEENAYKVFGRITNKTADRRFAYVIVEASLFEGDRLVDTCTCNVGTMIMKPGTVATFVGYIYSDERPKYDRLEARVAKFEEFE